MNQHRQQISQRPVPRDRRQRPRHRPGYRDRFANINARINGTLKVPATAPNVTPGGTVFSPFSARAMTGFRAEHRLRRPAVLHDQRRWHHHNFTLTASSGSGTVPEVFTATYRRFSGSASSQPKLGTTHRQPASEVNDGNVTTPNSVAPGGSPSHAGDGITTWTQASEGHRLIRLRRRRRPTSYYDVRLQPDRRNVFSLGGRPSRVDTPMVRARGG